MIMPSQQGPTLQSGLSLPLHHSIHCIRSGATTNFNVKCLVYTVGSLHEFLFAKYKMKYFIQSFQIGDIIIPSRYSGLVSAPHCIVLFTAKTGAKQ